MPRPLNINFNSSFMKSEPKKTEPLNHTERSYYNNNEKPNWNDELNKAIKGVARVETKPYAAFDEGEPISTETVYYDSQGHKLASVFNVRSKTSDTYNYNILKTQDGSYIDWDMDGNIDCKDIVTKA